MAHTHFKLYLKQWTFFTNLGSSHGRKMCPDICQPIPLLTTRCNFYKRYIDDIFLLWQGTLEELEVFTKQINKLHPTIKFTEEVSFNAIDFLDCHIYKSKDYTRLYTPKQQTENPTSTASHTSTASDTIQSHQKEALRIAKHYVSEEYVPKEKNTTKRQTS